MTPIYLLCYICYTTCTSILFSLLLALRLLLRRLFGYGHPNKLGNIVALYEGTVYHQRRHPARNSFRLTARYALIDLDLSPYNPPNYLSADDARRAAKTNGPVHLLRIPPSLGYERSPVNLYYCYDIEGSTRVLRKCLVEASNTPWGESVTFVFNPVSDTVPKSEYISPFMDMLGKWRLKVNEPGKNMYAIISVQHPKLGNHFTASYTAQRVNIISSNMYSEDFEAFFWLMPHKVSVTAYLNALKLWWKNVPFYTHPRIENPSYREQAFGNEKVRLCPAFRANETNTYRQVEERINRSFIWKDAKWPWSYLIK